MANRRNRKLVPECQQSIDRMKFEIASELGLPFAGELAGAGAAADAEFASEFGTAGGAQAAGRRSYLGNITAREAGTLGGNITKRLIQQAENTVL
jgi:general stress protein YciG